MNKKLCAILTGITLMSPNQPLAATIEILSRKHGVIKRQTKISSERGAQKGIKWVINRSPRNIKVRFKSKLGETIDFNVPQLSARQIRYDGLYAQELSVDGEQTPNLNSQSRFIWRGKLLKWRTQG